MEHSDREHGHSIQEPAPVETERQFSYFTEMCNVFNRSVMSAHHINIRIPNFLRVLVVIYEKLSEMSIVVDLVNPNPVISETQVPDFYALPIAVEDDWPRFFLAGTLATIGAQFGAIHCAAWFFIFPSKDEEIIWRVCAAFITATPVVSWHCGVVVALAIVYLIRKFGGNDRAYGMLDNSFGTAASLIICAGPIIYIMARLALLVVALTSLRDIPPTAYLEVKWLSFIPHI